MKERIRTSILVILAAVALIATVVSIYSAEYVGGLACAVVLASVVFDLFDPKQKQTTEFSPRLQKELDSMIRLRPYKIPKKVIEYYDENYPYLVVAENPNGNAVEYWWASDKEAECPEHSRIADKYVQLGHWVMSEPLKEEVPGVMSKPGWVIPEWGIPEPVKEEDHG